jgi:hypothetical protein
MRLEQRMKTRGFPPTDRLFTHVAAARKALADLNGVLSGYNNPCYFPRPLDDDDGRPSPSTYSIDPPRPLCAIRAANTAGTR